MKRIIAIYLPQYHPFTENDEWWGKGFTEWTNVAKARPLFRGHYQPHLPADLGFYDLRVPETMQAQADLAGEHGIYGFCYYHYWFNGHLLMERPINDMLRSGKPDFPFMLCWANENWTRAWDGGDRQILIRQTYSAEDDVAHINYLLDNVLCDRRYIRVDGRPVIAIYRSSLFPDIAKSMGIWRAEARKRGVDLYICRFEAFGEVVTDLESVGFDAAVEFPPHDIIPLMWKYRHFRYSVNNFWRRKFGHALTLDRFRYEWYVEERLASAACRPDYKRYSCILPMWDNSPRKGRESFVMTGSTPALYKKLLKGMLASFEPYSRDENLFFINAWNEWAEGNHLEPDQRWGRQYLEATKEAVDEDSRS